MFCADKENWNGESSTFALTQLGHFGHEMPALLPRTPWETVIHKMANQDKRQESGASVEATQGPST